MPCQDPGTLADFGLPMGDGAVAGGGTQGLGDERAIAASWRGERGGARTATGRFVASTAGVLVMEWARCTPTFGIARFGSVVVRWGASVTSAELGYM